MDPGRSSIWFEVWIWIIFIVVFGSQSNSEPYTNWIGTPDWIRIKIKIKIKNSVFILRILFLKILKVNPHLWFWVQGNGGIYEKELIRIQKEVLYESGTENPVCFSLQRLKSGVQDHLKCSRFETYTVCPRSSDPFYIVCYYINWVTASWTHSICIAFSLHCFYFLFRCPVPWMLLIYAAILVDWALTIFPNHGRYWS